MKDNAKRYYLGAWHVDRKWPSGNYSPKRGTPEDGFCWKFWHDVTREKIDYEGKYFLDPPYNSPEELRDDTIAFLVKRGIRMESPELRKAIEKIIKDCTEHHKGYTQLHRGNMKIALYAYLF